MKIEDALAASIINAAYAPYYLGETSLRQKLIISFGNLGYVYVVWSDSKEYLYDLRDYEQYKVDNRDDWEPVGPVGMCKTGLF